MNRLNRWMLLGLLAVIGTFSTPAAAQTLGGMRIGTSLEGATFFVDGQRFTSTQLFAWPEGTTHVVQFPTITDDDGANVQYALPGTRYTFGGWTATQQAPLSGTYSGNIVTVVADPRFTDLIAQVTLEFQIRLSFNIPFVSTYCQQNISLEAAPSVDVAGVVYFDGQCTNSSKTFWFQLGTTHTVQVFNYPGFAFSGVMQDGVLHPMPMNFDLKVTGSTEYTFVFDRAKRVRFSTYPAGLEVLVDRNPITPQYVYNFLLTSENNLGLGTCSAYRTLPIGVPIGVDPLCVGDFEFAVGSQHLLGARPTQRDANSVDWVFDHFSNGMGQNAVYVTPSNVTQVDDIQAVFVRGVQTSVRSNYTGLKVSVDGDNNWPGPVLYALWGEGQTHHVSAPETIRDSAGRLYRFLRWSDDGAREHDVVPAAGAQALNLTVYWELLGQVQVTSTPPGLSVKVDGTTCTTPCSFDKTVGEKLSVDAPLKQAISNVSRYDLVGWSGHPGAATQDVTFTADVITYNAVYHGSHTITATSLPEGGAKFTYSPSSPDGFFPEGTAVHISLKENPGFKFLKWGGDLTSKSMEEDVVVNAPVKIVAFGETVPVILPGGVQNAAGDNPFHTVAPGSLISIFGEGLAPELSIGPSNPLSQAIGETYVTVDDTYMLPLMFVSPKQINAQLVSSLSDGDHNVTVYTTGRPPLTQKFKVKRNAPGVFFNVTKSGMPLLAALHEDGTAITEASPALRGETITFYGTGYGAYDRPAIDGFPLPKTAVYTLIDPVHVVVNTPAPPTAASDAAAADPVEKNADATVVVPDPIVSVPVSSIGGTGMVGISVFRWKIDDKQPAGSVLEIMVSSNNLPSNKVQLPVK